jgi:hypothetical protein
MLLVLRRVLAERVILQTAIAETLGLLALPEMRGLHPRGCQKLSPEALLETVVLAVVAVLAVIGGMTGEPLLGGVRQLLLTPEPQALPEMLGVEPGALLPAVALRGVVAVAVAQAHVIAALQALQQTLAVARLVARAVILEEALEHRGARLE